MTTPTTRSRLIGLDGPRGMACLCVMSVHVIGFFAPKQMEAGRLNYLAEAIVFFFALSGFLIYLPFVRAYAAGQPMPGLRRYSSQRIRRVYPGYVVIFLVANLVLAAVYVGSATTTAVAGTDDGSGRITSPGRLLAHLTLVQNLSADELQTGIAPSWSLTTELSFYILLPVLVWLFLRGRPGRAPRLGIALLPAIAMAVIGVVGKIVTAQLQTQRPPMSVYDAEFGPNAIAVLSRSIVVIADNFAYGMVAVVLFVWMERGGLRRITARKLWLVCAPGWVFFLFVSLVLSNLGSRFTGTALAIASGLFLVLVTEPSARGRNAWLGRLVDVVPLRFIGKISLSVYLWHYPVILLVARHDLAGSDTTGGMLVSLALVSAVTIALSMLTYHFVEAPAMRGGRATARTVTAA
ncbi:acyltransferase [Aeromicrobium panaciterrae]|uniref:acyltransferase family protein n=1 Tax=Aeromicrobium panaciterrae TaxID=363861 RepID=UPI0031D54542